MQLSGKVRSRETPVRHDLEGSLRSYLDATGLKGENTQIGHRSANPWRGRGVNCVAVDNVCPMVKGRLKDARRLSWHPFRVTSIDLVRSGNRDAISIDGNLLSRLLGKLIASRFPVPAPVPRALGYEREAHHLQLWCCTNPLRLALRRPRVADGFGGQDQAPPDCGGVAP